MTDAELWSRAVIAWHMELLLCYRKQDFLSLLSFLFTLRLVHSSFIALYQYEASTRLVHDLSQSELGPVQTYLGIDIIREKNSIILNQKRYIEKILKRFNSLELM